MPCQWKAGGVFHGHQRNVVCFFFKFYIYKHKYVCCCFYDGILKRVSHRRASVWTYVGFGSFLYSSALNSLTQSLLCTYWFSSPLQKIPAWDVVFTLSFPLLFSPRAYFFFLFIFLLHFESCVHQPLEKARALTKLWRPCCGAWPELTLSSSLQVINKYGDLYGAERIAELLGLDKNALDFSPVEENKAEAASLVSWYRA